MAEPKKKSELERAKAIALEQGIDGDALIDEFASVVAEKQAGKLKDALNKLKNGLVDEVKGGLAVELVEKIGGVAEQIQNELSKQIEAVRTETQTAINGLIQSLPQAVQAEFAINRDAILNSINQMLSSKVEAGAGGGVGQALVSASGGKGDLLSVLAPHILPYIFGQGGGGASAITAKLNEVADIISAVDRIRGTSQSPLEDKMVEIAGRAYLKGLEDKGRGGTPSPKVSGESLKVAPKQSTEHSKPRVGKLTDLFK